MANVPIYTEQGGKKMVIGDGAVLQVEAGGSINTSGSAVAVTDGVVLSSGKMFVAAGADDVTATGMAQNVAHGLGVVPSAVVIVPTSNDGLADAEFIITQGMHTDENIVFTATAGLVVSIIAWG